MGNLFGGNKGGNAADQARRQEMWRQQHITTGMSQINSIFGGGAYGTNPVSQWSKSQYPNYFTGSGTKISDLTLTDPNFAAWAKSNLGTYHADTGRFDQRSGHGTPYPNIDPVADVLFGHEPKYPGLTMEDARRVYSHNLSNQGLLYGGSANAPGFNNDFYNQKQQAYIGYALPQVASQYNQMNQNTAFNLANRGLTQSSAGNMLRGSLEKERQLQTQGVGDAAIEQSNQLQKDVEGQRSSLVSQLYASGDPNTSMQGALNTAANFQTPNTYQPLGNLFSNWANMYLAKQYSGAPQTPGGGMGAYNPYGMTMPGAFGQQQMMPSIVGSSSSIVR